MYYIVLLETWGDSKAIKNLPVDHNNKQAVLPWQPYCGHFHTELKGILHQKNFYRLNLIFWIVMGCGIARFGRRGLKTTET